MLRSVEQWKEILNELSPREAAKRILGDITHYYHDRPHEAEDQKQLANELLAYALLGIPPKDAS